MDCAYLFCAAFSNFIAGNLIFRLSARIVANLCIFLLACIYILMVFSSYYTNLPFVFICYQGLAGLFIGPLLAGGVSLCDNWFSKQKRGLVLGLWSTGSPLGNVAGAYIATFILNYLHFSWQALILIASMIQLLSAFLMLFIKERP